MIDTLIQRLTVQTQSFATITHAQDQQPVDDLNSQTPLLGIFPGQDSTESDGTDFLESKMLTIVVLVHMVCLIEELDTLKPELRGAVIGWSPGAQYTDMELVSGELLQLKGGLVWWEEKYSTRRLIREST